MEGLQARGARAYQEMQVLSRSPLELVVLLYDGALRFLRQAQRAVAQGDAHARREAVSRTLAIIGELQSSLNMREGRDIATRLDALYTYLTSRLLEVATHKDMTAIDEAIRILTPLREAWAEIATPRTGL